MGYASTMQRHWILGVALLTVPLRAQGFEDVTLMSGLEFVPASGLYLGSGVCTADFDGDGDMDVLAGNNPGGPMGLFENVGSMNFIERSAGSGLGNATLIRAIYAADIDNDGDQDVLVRRRHDPTQLFINDGSASFAEEAVARGVVDFAASDGFAGCFGDYDLDGWLDICLGNRDGQDPGCCSLDQLLRGDGDGTFTDVTFSSGVIHDGLTLDASFVDYDEDGWPDLFFANDKGGSNLPNKLFRNQGDGSFVDVSQQTNTEQAVDGMGLDYLDLFNDGGVDLFVADEGPDHLLQIWNPLTESYGIDQATYGPFGGPFLTGWASHFLDFDNDGWQDLHVVHSDGPNHLYRNPAAPASAMVPFAEVGSSLGVGLDFPELCAITADFDDDGRVDLLHRLELLGFPTPPTGLRLMRNAVPGGHWLKIKTVGTRSNRDGFGTRVKVAAGGLIQSQQVRNGRGYLGGSDPRVHVGLGNETQCTVGLTWPSRTTQVLYQVQADQILEVTEPEFVAPDVIAVGGAGTLELRVPDEVGRAYAILLAASDAPGVPTIDGRVLPIAFDAVTAFTLSAGNPVLGSPFGVVGANGTAASTLSLPPIASLSGLELYATAVTIAPFGQIGTVFGEAARIDIQ